MSDLKCTYCGADNPPGGDARNMWISYHEWWAHRLYWTIKKKWKQYHDHRNR